MGKSTIIFKKPDYISIFVIIYPASSSITRKASHHFGKKVFDYLTNKLDRIEKRIEESAEAEEYKENVHKLECFLGVRTITAYHLDKCHFILVAIRFS